MGVGRLRSREFSEWHRNFLLVASDPAGAKERAMSLVRNWSLPHKDNLFEIEKAIDVSSFTEGNCFRCC